MRNGTTAIATFTSKSALTYTTPVTAGTIYKDLGLATGTNGTKVAYIQNGGTPTEVTVALNANTPVLGGFGVVTEVYRLPDGSYRIVEVKPTVGQVNNVFTGKELNGSAYTQYNIAYGNAQTATGKVYSSALNNETDTIVLNGTVAKGDYVTFCTVGGVTYVTPTTTITGALTGFSSATATYTIGGTGYMMSSATGVVPPSVYNVPGAYALDAYGYLLCPVTAEAGVNTDYLYLVGARNSWTLNGTTLTQSVVADVVFYDGTVDTVTLNVVPTTSDPVIPAGLYTYSVTQFGTYALGDSAINAINGATLAPGNPSVVPGVYANNATKFIYLNKNADGTFAGTVNIITGYASIPAGTGVKGAYVNVNENVDAIAEVVFISESNATTTAINYAYYLGTFSTTDGKTMAYDFIVNGEKVAVVLTAAPANGTDNPIGMYEFNEI